MFGFSILLFILLQCSPFGVLKAVNDLRNVCLDGKNHKKVPGPESDLFSECVPWKNRSCCTENTTNTIKEMNLYNFDYNHCKEVKPLSKECKKHFIWDLCFYECSPNLGPWIVKVNMKIRKERFYKVPLCKNDCDEWFKDCQDDYTCASKWTSHFQWNSTNKCKYDAKCVTFAEIYRNAKNFCEVIWDHSWEYTIDKPCMRMWFSDLNGNPNDEVTRLKILESTSTPQTSFIPEENSFDLSDLILYIVIIFLITTCCVCFIKAYRN